MEDLREDLRSNTEEENIKEEKPKLKILSDDEYEAALDSVKDMDFIEASRCLKNMREEKEEMESVKIMIESFKNSEQNLNDIIQISNVVDELNTEFDIDSFLDNYELLVSRISGMINKLEDRVHEFDDIEKTTSYLTNSVLHFIEKKEKIIKEKEMKSNLPFVVYYKRLREVYENRNQTYFLFNKLKSQAANIARLKRDATKTKNWIDVSDKRIRKTLSPFFDDMRVNIIEEYITELFKDKKTALLFIEFISNMAENNRKFKKNGEYRWVQILFMNILDIHVGIYDLEGGKEKFDAELLKLKAYF